MDVVQEDLDDLNEETFGSAEAGDWESEHERFALEQCVTDPMAPEADELPRFWESSDEISFLWQPVFTDPFKSYFEDETKERGVDVEETLKKMVSEEDTFEDPAILDISKRVSNQKLYGSTLEKILGAPAYPSIASSIFDGCRGIWSSSEASATTSAGRLPQVSRSSSHSIMDLLKQMTKPSTEHNDTASVTDLKASESSASTNLLHKLFEIPICTKSSSPYQNVLVTDANSIEKSVTPCRSVHSSLSGFPPQQLEPPGRVASAVPSVLTQTPPYYFVSDPCKGQMNIPGWLPTRAVPGVVQQPLGVPQFPYRPPVFNDSRNSAMRLFLLNARWNIGSSQLCNRVPPPPHFFQYFPPPVPRTVPMSPWPHTFTGFPPCFGATPGSLQPVPVHTTLTNQMTPSSSSTVPLGSVRTDSQLVELNASADYAETFDPNNGGWMTRFESVGVLLMQLRPLAVSNPYVQDYYFAIRWLRQLSLARAKRLTNGNKPPFGLPPAIMSIPSPLTAENLIDYTHYHQTTLAYKFVIPMAALPPLTRPPTPQTAIVVVNHSPEKSPSKPTNALLDTSASQPDVTRSDSTSALGRATRSNVNRPRIVAELSLASALCDNTTKEDLGSDGFSDTEVGAVSSAIRSNGPVVTTAVHSSRSLKSARFRRLELARIERMYTLILHIDEVDISISRLVIHNDMHSRLLLHRQKLVEHLIRELLQSSRSQDSDKSISNGRPVPIGSCLIELFAIHKGIRLFALTLCYLPPPLLQLCLCQFLLRYHVLHSLYTPYHKEFNSTLYSSLRRAILQITDMGIFMQSSFPTISDSLSSGGPPDEYIQALVTSELGISLILCLLDACARLSKPDDPSNFVRYSAYFAYLVGTQQSADVICPIEPFPHLASIIPVYVIPDKHDHLTSEHVERFCAMIHRHVSTQPKVDSDPTTDCSVVALTDVQLPSSGVVNTAKSDPPTNSPTPILAI